MSVRCKFKVDSIKRINGSTSVKDDAGNWKSVPCEMWSVEMSPVYAGNDATHENKAFWDATPSGRLEFGTVNKAAVETLELGAEYYIDITPATK